MKRKTGLWIAMLLLAGMAGLWLFNKRMPLLSHRFGDVVDTYNGVKIYYNGSVSHVSGRSLAPDKYNLGLKYQCVEFVKRYYYERLHHKMPDASGNAKDFFDPILPDGAFNKKRALYQYANHSLSRPKVDDLLIFNGGGFNPYGHVAIISEVTENEIEIVQQNPGPGASPRVKIPLTRQNGQWVVGRSQTLGWLRKL